jgi:hypothetical protein
MPHQMWKHTCSKTRSTNSTGSPVCGTCGERGEYDGWRRGMHEAMAVYQTFYRLKPNGPHRRMTDELFASARASCNGCKGEGLQDASDGRSWQLCGICRGFGSVFTRSANEIEGLRRQVLAAYPDAAANPVPRIFSQPVIFSEATQEVITVPKKQAGDPNASAPYEPVFNVAPTDRGRGQDALAAVPSTDEIRHLESVMRLTTHSSPLEQLRLWQPTDKGDQHLRCFLLDFGHRVLAAERSRNAQ